MANINQKIAQELGVRAEQVEAAVTLLDGGATVPFIARYRKEATGALDDTQLRTLEERLRYLRELEDRRKAILESVREQGKLDAALEAAILAADSKARLEDIYLPFKPKRRTKAQIAREAGLEPLAEPLLADPSNDPKVEAAAFVNAEKGVADVAAALDGARAILVERFAEDADLIGGLREEMWTNARMASKVRDGKKTEGEKFADYFDFSEPLTKLPSHRILALFRGEKEEILDLADRRPRPKRRRRGVAGRLELKICKRFGIADLKRAGDRWLIDTVRWAWRTKISGASRTSICACGCGTRPRTRRSACSPPICATCCSPRPPARASTMGLDPGYPHRRQGRGRRRDRQGRRRPPRSIRTSRSGSWDEVACDRSAACAKHQRRADRDRQRHRLARDRQARGRSRSRAIPSSKLTKIVVSEAGASVYSASASPRRSCPIST